MKVIDLLNKIANGEEVPKKIKYNNETFTIRKEKDDYANQNHWFTDRFCLLDLNDEVEIIEEDKKIEKLDIYNCFEQLGDSLLAKERLDYNFNAISDKINEIIDYLKEK